MTNVAAPLPTRRPELLVSPLGDNGQHVVKDPASGGYFHLGGQEAFLLEQLDGARSPQAICAAFESEFDEPLSEEELDEFVTLARVQGFLQPVGLPPTTESPERAAPEQGEAETPQQVRQAPAVPTPTPAPAKRRQSILYWRISIFDPDRLFNWLQPKIWFFWTSAFFLVSALSIAAAAMIAWANSRELVTYFSSGLRWETLLLAWLALVVVTTCHEFAHGLTCKRYGGEVHEIGFLMMFFMPCFYCNVSDAWLFREKSKRLWVTAAGAYCDLCIWALAVFVWRLTYQGSMVNYLAWVVMSVAGFRTFFNCNPLIKLDGYYLLSDLLEFPNLRQRAIGYVHAHFRWLLWGAPRPEDESRGKFLIVYGLLAWSFSIVFVSFLLLALGGWLRASAGIVGMAIAAVLAVKVGRGLLGGLFAGEFKTMIWKRHKRKTFLLAMVIMMITASFLVPWTEKAEGPFEVRAVTRAEIRAPAAAFLREVFADEGELVPSDNRVVQLDIPDLASRITQKQAELREAEAKLALARAGARQEEIEQQQRRVQSARAWRDVVQNNLQRQKLALEKDLLRFDKLMAEYKAIQSYDRSVVTRLERLHNQGNVSEDNYLAAKKQYLVSEAQFEKTLAEKESRAALSTMTAESELAEREKELVIEEATLALLKAGTRREEIEAVEASVERLKEETEYLTQLENRLSVASPIPGSITTPDLKDKLGDFFQEGDLICEVEDPKSLEIVIMLGEDQAAKVKAGQMVRLKARVLPFEVLEVEVDRVAPRAVEGELQSKVAVYCRMKDSSDALRSGMTGHAQIKSGRAPMALVVSKKVMQYLRTEFWW